MTYIILILYIHYIYFLNTLTCIYIYTLNIVYLFDIYIYILCYSIRFYMDDTDTINTVFFLAFYRLHVLICVNLVEPASWMCLQASEVAVSWLEWTHKKAALVVSSRCFEFLTGIIILALLDCKSCASFAQSLSPGTIILCNSCSSLAGVRNGATNQVLPDVLLPDFRFLTKYDLTNTFLSKTAWCFTSFCDGREEYGDDCCGHATISKFCSGP